MKNDQYFMQLALKEAKKAEIKGEVPVGCIIVDAQGKVISRGHNLTELLFDPTAHAELLAIKKCAKKLKSWRLDGATLYSTLQPCLMCMGAVINSRITRLVYGADDPQIEGINYIFELEDIYPQVKKLSILKYVLNEECSEMLKNFFKTLRT
jgi:tRNA(adenine34) deaminase